LGLDGPNRKREFLSFQLHPENKKQIVRAIGNYLAANFAAPDTFKGRIKRYLEKLSKTISDWGKNQGSSREIQGIVKKYYDKWGNTKSGKTEYYLKGCKDYFKKLI